MRVRVYHDGLHESSGALETLLRRLCPVISECDFIPSKNVSRRLLHGKEKRLVKKAIICVEEALRDGFDAVVLLIDEDGDRSRVMDINEAVDRPSPVGSVKRAFGVAIRSFDAWMIADEWAMSQVLGRSVDRTKAVEDLPDPKSTARGICGGAKALRDFYALIAQLVRIDELDERCPRGFTPFAAQVRSW